MTEELYSQWIDAHVQAAGRGGLFDTRLRDLLAANKHNFDKYNATYAELCECSDRIIGDARVPEYLDQHTNAIIRELRFVREDAARAKRVEQQRDLYAKRDPRCDCPACNGGEIKPSWEAAMQRLRGVMQGIGRGE